MEIKKPILKNVSRIYTTATGVKVKHKFVFDTKGKVKKRVLTVI